MAYAEPRQNKYGKSYKGIAKVNGHVIATKTFRVKGRQDKTTENQAYNWALEIEKQYREGIYRKPEKKANFTVKEAIEKYIADGNPKKKTENARRAYINALEWFKKEIGNIPIKTLERSDIKKCRDKLKRKYKEIPIQGHPGKGKKTDKFISNSTINRYLAYFSTFLTYCVDEYEILQANPMIGAKLKLKENDARDRWLSLLDERLTLLEYCKKANYELYLCALFALTTGARKSEILNLTWEYANLENKAIFFIETKNGEDRTVAMPEILYKELLNLKKINNVIKIKDKAKDNYLFKTPTGKPKTSLIDKLYPKVIEEWTEKTGYEGILFHGLRHTYSSIGALIGFNTDIMDKITGHKNGRMTSRYTHADCESLRDIMNTISTYMLTGKKENNDTMLQEFVK